MNLDIDSDANAIHCIVISSQYKAEGTHLDLYLQKYNGVPGKPNLLLF